jgi:DNA-binding GntR family transcriptional regulator
VTDFSIPNTFPPEAGLARGLYQRLKAEITSLRLVPGQMLHETELAARHGVSRTPVREALQQLLRDRLLERAGRFYQVIHLGPREVRELCELREALECKAVELAVARAPGLAPSLYALLARQEAALQAGEADRANALDSAFHQHISEAAGNAALARQLATLQDHLCLLRGMEQHSPQWSRRVIADHRHIVEAIERADAAIAVAEMRHHIRGLLRPWNAETDQDPPP